MNSQPTTHNLQLIFLVGPTATGKSSLAFELAEKMNAHILSADSRQIYKGLGITSGADIPEQFSTVETQSIASLPTFANAQTFFENDHGTKLFGISLLQPTEAWSIAQFREYGLQVIDTCKQEHKNLIIVGGSGLYLQSLFIDDPKLNVPPNAILRTQLEALSLTELQKNLAQVNVQHWSLLNNSDRNNPRRLIRAIEIYSDTSRDAIHRVSPFSTIQGCEQHWFGLSIDNEILQTRIEERVIERIERGAVQEIEKLLSTTVETQSIASLPASSATGIKELTAYINSQIEKEDLIKLWTLREFKYAKRQKTWFKKQKEIHWYDALTTTADDLIKEISTIQD